MLTKTYLIVSAHLGQSEHEYSIIIKDHISYGELFTFCFALKRTGLIRRPSDLVSSVIITVNEQRVLFFNSIVKKISKRVGARTQPCFTPILIVNDSKTLHNIGLLPSCWCKNTSQCLIGLEGIQSSTISQTVLPHLLDRKL